MTMIELKKVTLEDLKTLQTISRNTYYEAFAAQNSEATMTAYLKTAFSEKQLKTELTEKASEFYFAQSENEIIGYLKINVGLAQTDLRENNAMELERIYILKAFQGRNIGKKLLFKIIQMAKEKAFRYLWLGVWEENEGAIRFYKRYGFKIQGTHPFKMGDEIQNDYIMKLML